MTFTCQHDPCVTVEDPCVTVDDPCVTVDVVPTNVLPPNNTLLEGLATILDNPAITVRY